MFIQRQIPQPQLTPIESHYRRVSKEGIVLCAPVKKAKYPRCSNFKEEWGCLSFMAARGEPELYHFDRKTLPVDNTTYLMINPGTRYDYELDAKSINTTMMITFPRDMVLTVENSLLSKGNNIFDRGNYDIKPPISFRENLSMYDKETSYRLGEIMRACIEGETDKGWFYEQVSLFLGHLIWKELNISNRIESLPNKKESTKLELSKRVFRATDYIHENFKSQLTLEEMAKVGCLSPFHFLRAFKLIHGVTPFNFLRDKRIFTAGQLLRNGQIPISEIAKQVGFKNRSSFHRCFRKTVKMTPLTYRKMTLNL